MFRTGTLLAALALVAMLAAPAVAQDEKPDWAALLAKKAANVVSIKFVFNVKVMVNGQVMQDAEQNSEIRATLINDKGLVMAANSQFFPKVNNPRFQVEFGQPRNLKVLFGTEEKEYDAQIVAKDTKLDLIFLQIMNLEGREIAFANLAVENEPAIGQDLFTVSRLSRGFDNAPVLGRLSVTGAVEKPRRMWAISGNLGGPGMPIYGLDGEVVGVISMQTGSEGVAGRQAEPRPFVLPLKTLKAQLKMAEERATKALEKAAEEAEDAAEDAAEEGDG
ncbi:MAG: serine protease, partial [Planctomycetota bacterium]